MRTIGRWTALALAGLVVLSGCGSDDNDEAVTSPPSTTTTTAPTDDEPVPVMVDGIPQVTVTPTRGVVGTRVHIDGYGFRGEWQDGEPVLWLGHDDEDGCDLLAETDADLTLGTDGHLSGSFVVPAEGLCQDQPDRPVRLRGLTMDIRYRCSVNCNVGSFTIILPGESTEEPTGTACEGLVAFGLGEDAIGDIHADGLSCADAKAFLQTHAEPTGAMNGAAHIEAEGFTCDRTGQSDETLPRSNYKCTRGAQAIFFIRT